LGIVTIDFDFSANQNSAAVASLLNSAFDGGVVLGLSSVSYFAVLDADGSSPDIYNLFEVQNTTSGAAFNFTSPGVTISHIAAIDAIVNASDFVV
jgi:hypothetical protein